MALVVGTNCGFVTTAPTTDPQSNRETQIDTVKRAFKVVAPSGAGKVVEIGWFTGDATEEANFEVGIYAHDSANNKPNAVVGSLSQTNAKGTTAGWKKATGLNIAITAGVTYWIAIQLDDTATLTNIDIQSLMTGERMVRALDATELTDPWGDSAIASIDYALGIYAVYEAAAGTNIKINIGDTFKDVAEIKINIGDVWKPVVKVQQNIGDVWKTVFG